MEPNTATTATEPTNPGAEDMGAAMSDAELEAFVDATLGSKAPKTAKVEDTADDSGKPKDDGATGKDAAKVTTDTDKGDTKDAADKSKEDEKSKTEDLVEAAKQDEEVKPADIPAVDLSDLYVDIDAYVVDAKGENPKEETIRLNVGDSIPENARFKNDKQLYEVLEAQAEMREMRDARNAEYEEKKAEADSKVSAATAQSEQLAGWDAEINELIADGDIVAPKVKIGEPGFLEDPSTKLIDNVFKFMKTENDKRIANKETPIRSFAVAFNKYNKSEEVKTNKAKEDAEAAATKTRGAMVGGGTSSGGSGGTQKIYKSGSAKNIYQVDTSDL